MDVDSYIDERRANITFKYTNFCRRNYIAPLHIKIQVLESCVTSSLLYSCETWGDYSPSKIETVFRHGIKSALSVRSCTNNEIVYLESGLYPLNIRIRKQQLKFWQSLTELLPNDQSNYIAKLLRLAVQYNIDYVKH